MRRKLRIPHDGYVLVGDGRKGLVLRNEGDELHPNLQLEQLLEAPENPPTHLQGTDKPPRAGYGARRSGIEQTDWHDLAEAKFAKDLVSTLEGVCRQKKVESIVIVAPPRTLAQLRDALPASVQRLVVAEIDKDLTKIPVHEIEQHLTAS